MKKKVVERIKKHKSTVGASIHKKMVIFTTTILTTERYDNVLHKKVKFYLILDSEKYL